MESEPTLDMVREWYGNGDFGQEYASDGMGNGAVLYKVNNKLFAFEWDDGGFEAVWEVTQEKWDDIAASYEEGYEEGFQSGP